MRIKIKNPLKFIYDPRSIIHHPKRGFTLIELCVSMAIIAILAAAGLSSFMTSQAKGKDSKRKGDLTQLSRSLELYYNDFGHYPASDANGNIISCVVPGCTTACEWGSGPFCSSKNSATVYMQQLPKDPAGTRKYFYWSDNASYAVYAWLENTKEAAMTPAVTTNCDTGSTTHVCTYGISSSNIRPYITP